MISNQRVWSDTPHATQKDVSVVSASLWSARGLCVCVYTSHLHASLPAAAARSQRLPRLVIMWAVFSISPVVTARYISAAPMTISCFLICRCVRFDGLILTPLSCRWTQISLASLLSHTLLLNTFLYVMCRCRLLCFVCALISMVHVCVCVVELVEGQQHKEAWSQGKRYSRMCECERVSGCLWQ